jgi:hypothetical protein
MVIATTQGLISQLAGRELFGKVHPMSNTTGLSPEAYTLLGNGELREQVPLSTKNPVAVGVQVPEGGNIFSIEDSAAQSVWNQLLVASPGVVNIVTPENSEDRI